MLDKLRKEAKKYEKEQVGYAEKKKHLETKMKKIKKSITEVSHFGKLLILLQLTLFHRMAMLNLKPWLPLKVTLSNWKRTVKKLLIWRKSLNRSRPSSKRSSTVSKVGD